MASEVKQIARDASYRKVPLLRHRKVQLSRSKAVVIAAAGAFSVVTAASATWSQEPQAQPARPGGPAKVSGATHEAARLTVTDQLALPTAEAADQQSSATLVQHAYQVRLTGTRDAIAQRQAARKAIATAPVASGSPQQIAQKMLGSFGWSSSQFACLDPLWEHESGWSVTADNPGSGAYGIPQALPGSRMASAGPDWQADAATQIRWGLEYIKGSYGSPCGAWAHEQATGWY
jgi:hypothetical protein